MEYYKEYPIRCKTCNEQLSCFASAYEDYLASGLSEEEALNAIGITDPCSRIAMTNPTIVTFNMENREVIEGFKSVDAADEADVRTGNTGRPVFNSCMGPAPPSQILNPVHNIPLNIRRTPPVTPGPQLFPRPTGLPGIQTIGVLQPAIQRQNSPFVQQAPQNVTSPPLIQPIIPDLDLNVPTGVGIPVNAPETNKFTEPTMVGVPTINNNPTVVQPTIYVGANKQVRVLNGRTYLAQ